MHKILLTYSGFVIACFAVIMAFITATTYVQLAVAILLYPVLVFSAFRIFPSKNRTQPGAEQEIEVLPTVRAEKNEETIQTEHIGITDIDKRLFLKLIGGTGIFLFLFSIFNKKSESLFFKSLPGSVSGKISLEDSAGKIIDPAQNQPTDGYRISEIDDNLISFYGFTNKDGSWFIMKEDTDTGSFRYIRGESNFPINWTGREKLKYDYYDNIF